MSEYLNRFQEIGRNQGYSEAIKRSILFGLSSMISSEFSTELEFKLYSIKQYIKGHRGIGNPLQVYYLDPSKIDYIYTGDHVNFISDGDWDKDRTCVEDWFRTTMMRKRFEKNIPWQEIEEYQILENRLEDQGHIDVLQLPPEKQSVEILREYYSHIEDLYKNIRTEGYKQQDELESATQFFGKKVRHPALNEIQVRIDREGKIMVTSGFHRFIICRLIDENSIPVRTKTRHLQWQHVRDKIYSAESNNEIPHEMRDELGHPELQDILCE